MSSFAITYNDLPRLRKDIDDIIKEYIKGAITNEMVTHKLVEYLESLVRDTICKRNVRCISSAILTEQYNALLRQGEYISPYDYILKRQADGGSLDVLLILAFLRRTTMAKMLEVLDNERNIGEISRIHEG